MTPYLFFAVLTADLAAGWHCYCFATILASPVSPVALGRTVGADSTAVTAPAGAAAQQRRGTATVRLGKGSPPPIRREKSRSASPQVASRPRAASG